MGGSELVKWTRKLKLSTIRLLRLKEGNHQIALGFVIGFFPCWFPTFGIGPALSLGLTKLVRGNVVAAAVAAALGSFAWPVLFYLSYKIGNIFRTLSQEPTIENIDQLLLEEVPSADYTETVEGLNRLGDMGLNFLYGSIWNSLFFTAVGYFAIRFILRRYRHALLRAFRTKRSRQRVSNAG